ncbi:hypothetical protein AKJ16_DCAP11644 [Drosera capensis]
MDDGIQLTGEKDSGVEEGMRGWRQSKFHVCRQGIGSLRCTWECLEQRKGIIPMGLCLHYSARACARQLMSKIKERFCDVKKLLCCPNSYQFSASVSQVFRSS